ncbi:hypothetical protein [Amycolatopsis thailandensis]|uniref:hypothetical protein n=1 Tax=Amycolatopsis thailandensis TaxID=589330 RepID=UPI003643825B
MLLQGLPDEVLTRVAPLFTEPRIVSMEDAVHEPEFDILVAATTHWNRSGHLHTVRGSTSLPTALTSRFTPPVRTR